MIANYQEINDFIIKVFNYYNGKINVINKAVLDINWANLMGYNVGGCSRLPNIVTINPMVIMRFRHSDTSVKICIIETIIHELYHTDQLINYPLYVSDINYNRSIEYSCENQTAIYIAGHMQEIHDVFGIRMKLRDNNAFRSYISRGNITILSYQRRYFAHHIFMCIDDMCHIEKSVAIKIYEYIQNNVDNKRNIILNINGERINVCFNNELITINKFNEIIFKYICTGIHGVKHKISYYKDTSELIIDIETKVLNLMCKKA